MECCYSELMPFIDAKLWDMEIKGEGIIRTSDEHYNKTGYDFCYDLMKEERADRRETLMRWLNKKKPAFFMKDSEYLRYAEDWLTDSHGFLNGAALLDAYDKRYAAHDERILRYQATVHRFVCHECDMEPGSVEIKDFHIRSKTCMCMGTHCEYSKEEQEAYLERYKEAEKKYNADMEAASKLKRKACERKQKEAKKKLDESLRIAIDEVNSARAARWNGECRLEPDDDEDEDSSDFYTDNGEDDSDMTDFDYASGGSDDEEEEEIDIGNSSDEDDDDDEPKPVPVPEPPKKKKAVPKKKAAKKKEAPEEEPKKVVKKKKATPISLPAKKKATN